MLFEKRMAGRRANIFFFEEIKGEKRESNFFFL
jgi:hypothetical protein